MNTETLRWVLDNLVVLPLAAWAMATIAFRSYPAGLFAGWLQGRRGPAEAEFQRVQWERTYGRVFDAKMLDERARRPDAPLPPELTAEQAAEAEARSKRLWWPVWGMRLASYLLGCVFCQHVWGLIMVVLMPQRARLLLACITQATILHALVFARAIDVPGRGQPPVSGGCPGNKARPEANPRRRIEEHSRMVQSPGGGAKLA